MQQLNARLRWLEQEGALYLLDGILHGIEKEGLRVERSGRIARTPHPKALGSALTHPRITTDYSEALLEFITPVHREIGPMLDELADLHRFAAEAIGEELIWAASMPCRIDDPKEVVIADYGSSHIGRLKHIYRVGLEHRYGRIMQSIAGIHYNFSLNAKLWPRLQALTRSESAPHQFVTEQYFGLIRNFRRHAWLLIYLFGASPALPAGMVRDGAGHGLEPLGKGTLIGRHATSLRMSDLGYSNKAQASLNICYNTLENYVHTLSEAVATPWPPYERIGVKVDGVYRQLNSNLLQIENEYYSDIRPKRVTDPGERPLQAIRDRGVEYVEVRILDINPFLPLGLDASQARFLDCFLLHCLLTESPWIENGECDEIRENQQRVVREGRRPGLKLVHRGKERTLKDWAGELLDQLQPLAQMLDRARGGTELSRAVAAEREKISDPGRTPSARLIAELERRGCDYDELILELSARHRAELLATPLREEERRELEAMAAASLAEQDRLEAESSGDFDAFVSDYISRGLKLAETGAA